MAASISRIRQAKQARNSEAYDDQKASGIVMESDPADLEQDLNNLRSQVNRIIDSSLLGNWYDAPPSDLKAIASLVDLINDTGGDFALIIQLANRRYGQPLTGAIDGVNLVFNTVVRFRHDGDRDEALYLNGVRLDEGDDYVASETVLGLGYDTITTANPPKLGDKLAIDFTPKA